MEQRDRRRPSAVRVMFEWSVDVPIWDLTPGVYGPVDDPAEIGVSAGLTAQLRAWGAEHDNAPNGPENFAWSSEEAAADWRRRGFNLARALQQELGPEVAVYFREDGSDRPAWSGPGL